MSIHRKIARFAANALLMEAGWISWLVIGFSTGGVGVFLSRAITLLRRSKRLRRIGALIGYRGGHQGAHRAHESHEIPATLLLSSGW